MYYYASKNNLKNPRIRFILIPYSTINYEI